MQSSLKLFLKRFNFESKIIRSNWFIYRWIFFFTTDQSQMNCFPLKIKQVSFENASSNNFKNNCIRKLKRLHIV